MKKATTAADKWGNANENENARRGSGRGVDIEKDVIMKLPLKLIHDLLSMI